MSIGSSVEPLGLSLNKLRSIYETGLVSTNKLQEKNVIAHSSYDDTAVSEVCLNCIKQIDGIGDSLLNQARGGIPLIFERKPDKVFLDFMRENATEILEKTNAQKSFFGEVIAKQIACQSLVSENKVVLKTLEDRANFSTLIILNLSSEKFEVESTGLSMEVRRDFVESSAIQYVLLSGKFIECCGGVMMVSQLTKIPEEKIIPVTDYVKSKDLYYPVSLDSNKMALKISFELERPDYDKTIRKLVGEEKIMKMTQEIPLFTHMTRLFTEEDKTVLVEKFQELSSHKQDQTSETRLKLIKEMLEEAEKTNSIRLEHKKE